MNERTPERNLRQGMDYGETSDVHQVHAAIQREKREPRVGLEPLSIWLIAVYGLAIFFGGAYLGRFAGNFSGDSLDPAVVPMPKKQGRADRAVSKLPNSLRPIAARKFSRRIARPATRRTVLVLPGNIHRLPVPNM
jgi:hypothetical protein